MVSVHKIIVSLLIIFSFCQDATAQKSSFDEVVQQFQHPSEDARPWVFWYWLHGAVSKEGITADLEAMKKVGISGAYMMFIKDTTSSFPFQPQMRQLTPKWWNMVGYALKEAERLGIKIAIHVGDGFAVAGGPWITPELSMQKLTWSKTYIDTGRREKIVLSQPSANENYYRDIAVFAYPANYDDRMERQGMRPVVTASNGENANFLADTSAGNQTFKSDEDCWIQYTYPALVTIRRIRIKKQNNAYQSQRFIIQKSDDGIHFVSVDTLHSPRMGWQDWNESYTHAVRNFSSRYIRFVWKKEGTEPGSEDLDAAKWKPVLRVKGIYPGEEPVINNYEGKNGSVWRVALNTSDVEVNGAEAVKPDSVLDISDRLLPGGVLNWMPPDAGNWIVVRIGHTSTGAFNATGGGGKGLETDKFNPAAAKIQFDHWFDRFYKETDSDIAKKVIEIFHVDSWECGSQNWSGDFEEEFKKRRGYNLKPWLLVMTGVPVGDAATSEKILHDVRQTIAELVNDEFYGTLKTLAHERNCEFSAESVAPTFVSDGLMHFGKVDIPMGEFWLNSPTHDKPNDILDAVSGAHIYGKNIVQAEAYTTLRLDWGEHPGNLKTLGDRIFATGINRFVIHVFMQNPWLNKKPGVTLDGIGLFYQRDQTWFAQSKAWLDYLARCQAVLQSGKPVTDIGVFTGEEVPRRSLLPERLINTLPGIFGSARVEDEKKRLKNQGQPLAVKPAGVTHAANMADPDDWIDPLRGYKYDSFNPDVLQKMSVKNGEIQLPDGNGYKILIFPGERPLNPNSSLISYPVAKKMLELVKAGATIVMNRSYLSGIGRMDDSAKLTAVIKELVDYDNKKGKIYFVPYEDTTFKNLGVEKDLEIPDNHNNIAWTHRKSGNTDIYFLSNQRSSSADFLLSFRVKDKIPYVFDPVDGTINPTTGPKEENGRTLIPIHFEPHQSFFVVFGEEKKRPSKRNISQKKVVQLKSWDISFPLKSDTVFIKTDTLQSWSTSNDPLVRYYSGSVSYKSEFRINHLINGANARIIFDAIYNIATVRINGVDCGTLWTFPYKLDISKAIRQGENEIEIIVTNTWRNRLLGDVLDPANKTTWFNSPYGLTEKKPLPSGLVGDVKIFY